MFPACTGSDGGGSIRIPSSYSGLFGMKTTFGLLGGGPGPFDYPSLTSVHGPDGAIGARRRPLRRRDARARRSTDSDVAAEAGGAVRGARSRPARRSSGCAGKRAAWRRRSATRCTDPEVEKLAHDAALALVDTPGSSSSTSRSTCRSPGMSWGILSSLGHRRLAPRRRARPPRRAHRGAPRRHGDDDAPARPSGVFKAIRRRHELLTASPRSGSQVDVLLTPTTPTTAFQAEGTLVGDGRRREVNLMGLSAAFTAPFNMTGNRRRASRAGSSTACRSRSRSSRAATRTSSASPPARSSKRLRPWPKFAPLAYDTTL